MLKTRQRYFDAVNQAWKSVLQPISIYREANLLRSIRDCKIMKQNEQRQPLTTVYARWPGNENYTSYTIDDVIEIFSHFGSIRRTRLQSPCSAFVTFDSIESACRAIGAKNIGISGYPIHVCWLPKANQNERWVKRSAFPKPYTLPDLVHDEECYEEPKAITDQSQIKCIVYGRNKYYS